LRTGESELQLVIFVRSQQKRNAAAPCAGSRWSEYQSEIIRGHLGRFDQGKTDTGRQSLDGLDVTYPPVGIGLAQACIKAFVARGSVTATAPEGTVKKKHPITGQALSGACEQPFGDTPWRDMNDIGAEDREQLARAAIALDCFAPGRIRQIDLSWRPNIRQLRMDAPGLDAREVFVVEVARPPNDLWKLARERNDMLPGAAAGLEDLTRFAGEKALKHAEDGVVVAVEGGRIETTVCLARPAILAKFDDIFGQFKLPDASRIRLADLSLSGDSVYALNHYIWSNQEREPRLDRSPLNPLS
jgi:hypothetical protein